MKYDYILLNAIENLKRTQETLEEFVDSGNTGIKELVEKNKRDIKELMLERLVIAYEEAVKGCYNMSLYNFTISPYGHIGEYTEEHYGITLQDFVEVLVDRGLLERV